jgi:hypothetical protein
VSLCLRQCVHGAAIVGGGGGGGAAVRLRCLGGEHGPLTVQPPTPAAAALMRVRPPCLVHAPGVLSTPAAESLWLRCLRRLPLLGACSSFTGGAVVTGSFGCYGVAGGGRAGLRGDGQVLHAAQALAHRVVEDVSALKRAPGTRTCSTSGCLAVGQPAASERRVARHPRCG